VLAGEVRIQMTGEPPSTTANGTVRPMHPCGRPKQARYFHRVDLWLIPGLFFAPALAIVVLVAASVIATKRFG